MAKLFKKILGAAAVGTAAAAGALYYWKKAKVDTDEFEDDFEDEDFDLDDDLKPAADREYVSLNSAPKSEAAAEETKEADETEEPAKEEPAEADEAEAADKEDDTKEEVKEEKETDNE